MHDPPDTRPGILLKTAAIQILLLWLLGSIDSAFAEERYALISGNSDYYHVSALKIPVNDARDIEATLEDLHFETRLLENATGRASVSGSKTLTFLTLGMGF